MLSQTDEKKSKVTKKPRSDAKRGHSVQAIMGCYTGVKDFKVKQRRSRYQGLRSKMGWEEYRFKVFEANEQASRAKKLTNAALEKMFIDEFGHYPQILRGFQSGKFAVNYHRLLYNIGRLRNSPPPQISFRYNEFGMAVDFRTGTKLLTPSDKEIIIKKYREQFIREGRVNGARSSARKAQRSDLQQTHLR